MKDKNGKRISIGDMVLIPKPSLKDDNWTYKFEGTVHCIRENGLICVEDQDENGWDIEANRVEKI